MKSPIKSQDFCLWVNWLIAHKWQHQKYQNLIRFFPVGLYMTINQLIHAYAPQCTEQGHAGRGRETVQSLSQCH